MTQHHHSLYQAKALRAAWISVVVTIILLALKLTAGLMSGSLAMLSLASESALDLFSVLLSLIAVRVSYMPADDDHQYGHGKFDSLVSLFQCIALLGVSVWIFLEGFGRITSPEHHQVTIDGFVFVVLIVSLLLDSWRSYTLHHTGKEAHSKALQTDAMHFLIDGLSNVIVLGGIAVFYFFHIASADSYAALGVSAFVAFLSIKQGKNAVDTLTDRFNSSAEYIEIKKQLEIIDGVLGTKRLRMRRAGPSLFIECGIEINRVLPFASVQYIIGVCEDTIIHSFTDAEINFYPVPIKTSSESAFETIKLIASEYGVLPHNIELARDHANELTLDLHLEFRPHSSFEEAHTLSSKIEERIHHDLPSIKLIVVHLEEERSDELLHTIEKLDVHSEVETTALESLIKSQFKEVRLVKDIELFRNETNSDLKLTSVVELDRTLSLFAAHEVSTLIENTIRKTYPHINRIVIHVEPEGAS